MVKMGADAYESESDIQGNARPLPGRYHAIIKDVQFQLKAAEKYVECEEDDNPDCIPIKFEVLAGTTPNQEGREITERFYTSEKAIPRLKRLAMATGLLRPREKEKEVLFSHVVGTQLVIEVEENKYTDRNGEEREGVRVGYMGIWSLENKEVEEVPKDRQSMRLSGKAASGKAAGGTDASGTEAATTGNGGSASEPSQEGREEAAAAAGGGGNTSTDDKWGDL